MTLDPKQRQELEARLREFVGVDVGPPWESPDGVNAAMIRHWCVVMGDENPVYLDAEAARKSVHGEVVAPPTMLQTWVFPPYIPPWAREEAEDAPAPNKEVELHRLLARHGYTGVVATNYDCRYQRYLRLGERIHARLRIEAISSEKGTPLGPGYFIDVRWDFFDEADEEVGSILFRVIRYAPAQPVRAAPEASAAPAKPTRLAPPLGHDNAWWWQGIERGELLIQRCTDCGRLRHPPRPMCGSCQSLAWEGVPASGRGHVYSYTVLHHPKVPGYDYPLAVALVELEEGTRLIANVVGDSSELAIGMPVVCRIETLEGGLKLPMFHPLESPGGAG